MKNTELITFHVMERQLTFDNSENTLCNSVLVKVIREANGKIDHLIEIFSEEVQALLNY